MAKMGALFSFFGVALSFLWAKLLKIEKKYWYIKRGKFPSFFMKIL
jgi:hypothetical protein